MALTTSEISSAVRSIIAQQLRVPVDSVTEASTLDTLGTDSLDRVDIVLTLEDHFSIEIDDAAAEKFTNVGDIVAYIQQHSKS